MYQCFSRSFCGARRKPAEPLVRPQFYAKLSEERKETRIIILHPGRWSDSLSCTLTTVSLLDSPVYETLSYAWGTDPPTRLINVNGSPFRITPNLERALRHLRRRTSTLHLWADAICINQADLAERGHQVALMRDVYTLCAEAHIWLGDFDPHRWRDELRDQGYELAEDRRTIQRWRDDKFVARTCREFAAAEDRTDLANTAARCDDKRLRGKGTIHEACCALEIMASKHAYEWPCFASSGNCADSEKLRRWAIAYDVIIWILSRPWWKRVWVLQEAVLPKVDPVVHIGHDTFSLALLHSAMAGFIDHFFYDRCCEKLLSVASGREYRKFGSLLARAHDLRLLRQPPRGRVLSVRHILQQTCSRLSSNPVDHYYGVMGLLMRSHPAVAEIVRPDYSRDLGSALSEATKLEVMVSKQLAFLDHCTGVADDLDPRGVPIHELPTWIIDITRPRNLNPLFYYWNRKCRTAYTQPLSLGSKELPVTGVYLDTIGRCLPTYQIMRRSSVLEDAAVIRADFTRSALERQMFVMANCKQYDHESLEAWALLFNGKRPWNNAALEPDDLEQVLEWVDELQDPKMVSLRVLQEAKEVLRANATHRLFATGCGYCGVGRQTCKPGDLVYAIRGCFAPVVLRKVGEGYGEMQKYQVVGLCYMPGFMDSEVFDGNCHEREIILV